MSRWVSSTKETTTSLSVDLLDEGKLRPILAGLEEGKRRVFSSGGSPRRRKRRRLMVSQIERQDGWTKRHDPGSSYKTRTIQPQSIVFDFVAIDIDFDSCLQSIEALDREQSCSVLNVFEIDYESVNGERVGEASLMQAREQMRNHGLKESCLVLSRVL
ncbi:hypothetical protein Bca4012_044020 [Brassica carinata]